MKVYLGAIAATALVVGLLIPAGAAHAATQHDEVHSQSNSQRVANSQRPLLRDATLDAVAQDWANQMSSAGKMVHSSNSWRSERIPPGWDTHGENIAYGYRSADAVVSAWMQSAGHRANILRGSFTRLGVGYVASGNYWVQIFAGYKADRLPDLGQTATPTISGTAKVGQVISAQAGTWGPAPVSFAYQWFSNGIPLQGQTSNTFAVKTTDVGEQISVAVTGSKSGYYPTTKRSQAVIPTTNMTVTRISGPDRYSVAATISASTFQSSVNTVILTTGANYPDALSAAPAAVKKNGPLLLTDPSILPAATRTELERLRPSTIIVVGGPTSVSESVVSQLESLAPEIVRIQGADRYEASRNVALSIFGSGASDAYVATGRNFPDALSAGSPAGRLGAPILLVDGAAPSADGATLDIVDQLGTDRVKIAGGTASVSPGIGDELRTAVGSVSRLAGPDRFAASLAINADAYRTAQRAYLSTALNFPDALAGSVLAARDAAPLFVTPTNCVPRGVLSEIQRMGVREVVLLGGPQSLDSSVAALKTCSF